MRKLRSLLLLAFTLLAGTAMLQAQNDDSTALFRGRGAPRYNFVYNGTYFWSGPEFSEGTVFYNGLKYEKILVNIDASRQELQVKRDEHSTAMVPDRNLAAWFTMSGSTFINLQYYGVQGAPEGFLEVLDLKGKTIFKQVLKEFYEDPGNHNGVKSIGYDDPKYKENVIAYFRIVERYYAFGEQGLEKVRVSASRRRSLAKAEIPQGLDDLGQYLRITYAEPEGMVLRSAEALAKGCTDELPAGFFDSDAKAREAKEAEQQAIDENNAMATYQNKIYEIGKQQATTPAKVTIKGTIRDITTGEAIPGVTVCDAAQKVYVQSGDDGRYRITVPSSTSEIRFSEFTKDDMNVKVHLMSDGQLDVVMKDRVISLEAARVTAESREKHRSAQMGVEKISMNTLSKIPTAFGEGDVLKAVLTLPGVKTVGEAASGFNVRGGSTDQNLILFGENTIYNPSHLFGIVSSFDSDIVESLELYKSSVPAEYGGRISSVLQVRSKEGNSKKLQGSLGIGILSSRAEIDGPIGDKTTFAAGVRTSYSDYLLKLIPTSSSYAGGSAGFTDASLSITHKVDDRNSLQAFGYWSADRFAFSSDTTFRYSNLNASLAWKHKTSKGGNLSVAAGYDQYTNSLADEGYPSASYELSTAVRQAFLRGGLKEQAGSHTYGYGASATAYFLNPGTMSPLGEASYIQARQLNRASAIEPALYISDTWRISESFDLDGGLRLSSFARFGEKSTFKLNPEGRISAKYSPTRNFSLKAGVNSMTQYIHLISNTSAVSPMDTWALTGGSIEPQVGYQAAAGAYWTIAGGMVDLSLEGYWKQMKGYLDYKAGAQLSMNENLEDDLVSTRGKAYGVEFMAKKIGGKLTGWVAYTYSRTFLQEMGDRGIATINGGNWYCASHDKPHDFKLVSNYHLTHRFSFSMNVDYSTGRPVTIPIGKYYDGTTLRLAYSERNGYRIPDYFRMDLAFNAEPGHYLKQLAHWSVTVGVYNVTGRRNAYSVYFTAKEGEGVQGHLVSVFATQIPYINLNIKF